MYTVSTGEEHPNDASHETDFFGRTSLAPSDRGLFFLFLNLHRSSGQPVLLAIVAGESAARMEKLGDEEVRDLYSHY